MSVIWGNSETEMNLDLKDAWKKYGTHGPEYPDPRAPRALSESFLDWVCRFTDVRLDTARMHEIASREFGVA